MSDNQKANEREIRVYLPLQDLREACAFMAPVNWCRIKRAAGKGRFCDHGRAFRLIEQKVNAFRVNPSIQIRDSSNVVDATVIEAYTEGQGWAIAIVRRWHRGVAAHEHRVSLARRRRSAK